MLDALSNEVAQNPDAMRDAAAGTERMNGQRRGNEICQQLHDLSRAKFRIEQAARALSDSKPGENGGMHVCRIIAAEPPQNRRYEIALAFRNANRWSPRDIDLPPVDACRGRTALAARRGWPDNRGWRPTNSFPWRPRRDSDPDLPACKSERPTIRLQGKTSERPVFILP